MRHDESVDFYLYASHEVPTWLPIVRSLRDLGVDARFVLEPPGVNLARGSSPDAGRGWHDDKRSGLVPLVDDVTWERLRAQLSDEGELPLARLRSRGAAVTSSGVGWLRPWSGARIRCMYGVGLVRDAWGHGAINAGFDLVLAPGPHPRREIGRACPDTPVVEVGFPKWAAYRRGEIRPAAAREALGLPTGRRVVLWLPTWADHSSLDRYQDAFEALDPELLIVIKPHHNSARFEAARLEHLRHLDPDRIRLVETSVHLPTLVAAADVIASDVRSGGLTEGLLGDRPVVAFADASTTPDHLLDSAQAAVHLCERPADLTGAIAAALDDPRRDARQRSAADLFGPPTGDDDRRAAAEIAAVVERIGRPASRRATAPVWKGAYRVARRLGR